MFKFNFSIDENAYQEKNINRDVPLTENRTYPNESEEEDNDDKDNQNGSGVLSYEELSVLKELNEKKEIEFKKLHFCINNNEDSNDESSKEFIEYVDSYKVKIDENDILSQINRTHDLVPGKYEGGLKVWELSIDLAHFVYGINFTDLNRISLNETSLAEYKMIQEFFDQFVSDPSSKHIELNILELGCGHGLPSLAVVKFLEEKYSRLSQNPNHKLKNIDVNIYLQDFNKQIIENITFENVKKFMETSNEITKINKRFRFAWGDWGKLYDTLPSNYFHLILTSETIYNPKNYYKLLNLFKKCLFQNEDKTAEETNLKKKLKRSSSTNRSIVLLSSKQYYFGVGGNLHEFLEQAKSNEYKFSCTNNLLLNNDAFHCTTKISELHDHANDNDADNENRNDRLKLNEQNDYNIISDCYNSSIKHNSSTRLIHHHHNHHHHVLPTLDSSSIAKEIIKLYFINKEK